MFTSEAWQQSLRRHGKKHLALYHALREDLVTGRDARLPIPSERQLAGLLDLSRGTVRLAYEMLAADGFISATPGKGYRAVDTIRRAEKKKPDQIPRLSRLARKAEAFHSEALTHTPGLKFDLRAGGAVGPASVRDWKTAIHRGLRETSYLDGSVLCDPAGWPPLRRSIAAHLRSRRGVDVVPERLIITNGSGQALALLCLLLLREGDRVPVENPSYAGTRAMIRLAGAIPVPLPLDEEGMPVPRFPARVAFLTPGNQYPTGQTFTRQRREELLNWAQRCGAILVEDDYDAEFRRRGLPPEPLCALAPDRVAYTGTFTRSMHRALRIGYVLLPAELVNPFLQLKRTFEESPGGMVEQAALAAFMQFGGYDRHLRRQTRIFTRRYETLHRIVASLPGSPFLIHPSQSGLHIFAEWLKSEDSFQRFCERCNESGLYFTTAERHYANRHRPAVLFGFARIAESRVMDTRRVLHRALERCGMKP